MIPVENSIEGSVNETYDLLLRTDLSVSGEIYQRINHCLIANWGTNSIIKKMAYSHPQALAQCRSYLQKKQLEPIATYDTAGSVKMLKEKKITDGVAIASRRADRNIRHGNSRRRN